MKKRICLLLAMLVIITCFSGCLPSWDKWMPYNYTSSTWNCSSPEITFYIDARAPYTGWIMCNGEKVYVDVYFEYVGRILFCLPDAEYYGVGTDDCILAGTPRAYEGKLIVTVEKDLLFDNEYKKIIFYMVDTPEETAAPEN